MKKLLLMAMILVCTISYSQTATIADDKEIPAKKTLVIDETEVVASGEKQFRVITTNNMITSNIWEKWRDREDVISYITHRRVEVKVKGKKEVYWEDTYYFKKEDYTRVVKWLKGGMK